MTLKVCGPFERIADGHLVRVKSAHTLSLATERRDVLGDFIDLAHDVSHELRDEKGRWVVSASNIVNRWKQATVGERTAGEAWYPAAHKTAVALSKKYGVSIDEAAGLLATYSPQTGWGRNQVEAAESLRENRGLGGPRAAMWFEHDDPNLEDRVGMMATGSTKTLAERVMAGTDFDTAVAGPLTKNGTHKPRGLKIRNFYHLIAAGGQADPEHPNVVIDRHAMSVAFGRRVTEEDYTRMRPGSNAKYAPFVDAYTKAAREISRMEGRTVSPETVQATTWLTQQRLNAAEKTAVGKTRAKLGNRDWAEWTAYAARYLGDTGLDSAQTGYAELATVRDAIDLAVKHDVSHELRDPDGKWTRTPGVTDLKALAKTAAKVMSVSKGKHRASTVVGKPVFANVKAEALYPEPEDRRDYVHMVASPGAAPGEETSVDTQIRAQIKAEGWYRKAPDAGDDEREAAGLWMAYQNPDQYGEINASLRGTGGELPKDQVAATARRMFQYGGTTTSKPITVFRALRTKPDSGPDWAKILTPGSTFQEEGIVSSTAYRRYAQGWLGLAGNASAKEDVKSIDSDSVVMEIRVPAGARVVGGVTQFIETMLPPGTKFKVISSQRTRTPNGVDPLSGKRVGKDIIYTHVIAEAILPDGYGKPVGRHRADTL